MLLPYSSIENISIKNACNRIIANEKKMIKDLKVIDLIMSNEKEYESRHGVYFFFNELNECLYVGKNSSQQFVERIPWHFALAEGSYGNHFLKYYKKRYGLSTIFEAAKHTRNCRLLIMPVDYEKEIKKIEKLFRVFSDPTLNSFKTAHQFKSKVPESTLVHDGVKLI